MEITVKRKLLAEQMDLPMPKHRCWNGSRTSKLFPLENKKPEALEYPPVHMDDGTSVDVLLDCLDPESACDSISVDQDAAMPVTCGANPPQCVGLQLTRELKENFQEIGYPMDYVNSGPDQSDMKFGIDLTGYPMDSIFNEYENFGPDQSDMEFGIDLMTSLTSFASGQENREATIDQEFEEYFSALVL